MTTRHREILGACLLLVIAAACGGGGGSGGSDRTPTGVLTLGLTDAPVDQVFAVNVQIKGVSIKPQEGSAIRFDFPAPVDVDLLSLHDGSVHALLDGEEVPAGPYNWIQLHTNAEFDGDIDSYVMETETGGQIELRVPSGDVRFVSGFVVTAGQMNAFALDWDVRKGLVNPVGLDGWILRPSFRLIDMTQYGSLTGTVADALIMDDSCSSDAEGNGDLVYVYDGHDAVPDDLGGSGAPVTTAPVRVDGAMAGAFTFEAPFLDPGPYTVAFTCQGLDDDPEVDQADTEHPVFLGQVNAIVEAGRGTANTTPMIE